MEINYQVHGEIAKLDANTAELNKTILELEKEMSELDKKIIETNKKIKFLHATTKAGWETNKNLLYIWIFVREMGTCGELPDWVRAYLFEVAEALLDIWVNSDLDPKTATKSIASALQLSRKSWNAYEDIRRFSIMADAAVEHILEINKGTKSESAAEQLARKYIITARTLYVYREKFRQYLQRERSIYRELPENPNDL